ncbi:MAG: inorganic phosphate transporter [Bacteroidales bacterium]
MDNIYLFFIAALFILAISDLIVGVGNDAVNFLNSAIGSKVASYKVILAIAGVGVLLGATFSSGMMEVARSGVFHPDQFYFNEIMVIFLAVMITDIILLDAFNTFGLPTSTTVSIIFELLGAAVAVSLYKIYSSPDAVQDLGNYINSARTLTIISGILLSVVFAFSVGALVQFLSRILFTFNFERNMPYFGAIWGSIAITSIVYFLLVKGAKGASFMTPNVIDWIGSNTTLILAVCFVGFAIISQLLISLFKVNIFRVIVLIGTFSIAMAFAGNDLVNFIGVPLAGFDSLKLFMADATIDPNSYTMESLLDPVRTPTYFLAGAGLIMIGALIFSKKAHSVTQTEVDLARQNEGSERFPSSLFARTLVRKTRDISNFLKLVLPKRFFKFIDKRFDDSLYKRRKRIKKDDSSFDQLRASVNMFVASILIAFATSFKLPLSTTYVTFMVAMGTSFADRSWGRDSAVYRITGVITVIGGWFFTAFTAFTIAFVIALLISWGGLIVAVVAIVVAFALMIKTTLIHKRRSEGRKNEEQKLSKEWTEEGVMQECSGNISRTFENVAESLSDIIVGFIHEDRKRLKKTRKRVKEINKYTKELKKDVYLTLKKLKKDSIDTGHHYVQILDYLREIAHCLNFITEPIYEHLENNHPTTIPEQEKVLLDVSGKISNLFMEIKEITRTGAFNELDVVINLSTSIIDDLEKIKRMQIKLIKAEKVGTKNSLIVFNLLTETKNILLHSVNVLKSQRDFLKKNGH